MLIYFDTSALAKRYIDETGSTDVASLCSQASQVQISCICISELISAFKRLFRESNIDKSTYQTLKHNFLEDTEQASVIALSALIIKQSITCLETVSLRAMDALHIASAMTVNCDLFVSADKQQVIAAQVLGLETRLV